MSVARAPLLLLGLLLLPDGARGATPDGLDPLYRRIASDLQAGRPLMVTVHVALCDNTVIWCGWKGFGDGDRPGRNLYWGGGAGFRATFDHASGYRRIHLDRGDGDGILERVVYRLRVLHPSSRWRRLGVTRPFEVLVVGLAHRGRLIARASDRFIEEVAAERGEIMTLDDGRRVAIGGLGHLLGYAGHNHLMDAVGYRFPGRRRRQPIGYFALSCQSGAYLRHHLCSAQSRALLLTLSLMYPGAFTIDGLVRGIAAGAPQHEVYLSGVERYARAQKRPETIIRKAFIHDGEARFRRLFGCGGEPDPAGRAD